MTKYLRNSAIFAAAAIITMSGCSSKEDVVVNNQVAQLQKTLDEKNAKISELEQEKSKALNSLNTESKDKNAVSNSLVPPNAKAGECYAKVLVPEQYETKMVKKLVKEAQTKIDVVPATYKVVEKQVTLREETSKLETIPATYKTVEERVLVKPETTQLVVVPATYKTVEERIMVEPEKTKLVTIPATYKNVSEQVLVKPAYTTWKRGRGEIEKVDNGTGDILCLVEVPAEYKTIVSKVIDTPASTKEIKAPAVYKTVTKQVEATPATTREIKIPAVYKTITKEAIATPATTREIKIPAVCKVVKTKEIDTPAKELKTEIPAVYTMVPTQVKIAESYLRWQPILCETNTTTNVISNLQRALQAKKYNITKIDGVYGSETKAAVRAYQRNNKLNEGALTLETLKSLGL